MKLLLLIALSDWIGIFGLVLAIISLAWGGMFRYSNLIHKVDGLVASMQKLEDKMDSKFEKIDARFEKMEAKYEKIDEKINNLKTDIHKVDLRVTGIEHELKSH